MPKLKKQEIVDKVGSQLQAATDYYNGNYEQFRIKALDYYYGNPLGNEVKGKSQVISHDVAEVIDSIEPALLRLYFSSENAIIARPRALADRIKADIATEYFKYVVNNANPGLEVFDDWFRSALMFRLGIVKVWWHEEQKVKTYYRQNLSTDELTALMLDDKLEVKILEEDEDADIKNWAINEGLQSAMSNMQYQETADGLVGEGIGTVVLPETFSVKIIETYCEECVKFDSVPTEEFLFDPWSKNSRSSDFLCHRKPYTKSEMIQRWGKSAIKDVNFTKTPSDPMEFTEEKWKRFEREASFSTLTRSYESLNPGNIVYVYEVYTWLDLDGDGIDSYCKVVLAGDGQQKLIEVEEVDDHPFAILTPIKVPFKMVGKSIADDTMDIQKLKSTLWRQSLDNIYQVNNARPIINDKVKIEDVLNPRGVIRAANPASDVGWWSPTVVAQHSLSMIDYVDSVREARTGITRYNQGLDAETLNKTKGGMELIRDMSNQKIDYIARLFGELGVKRLFKLIINLTVKHGKTEKMFRFSNGKVSTFEPEFLDFDYDLEINVGLGSGDRGKEAAAMGQVVQLTEKALATQGGSDGPFITDSEVYNTMFDFYKSLGVQNPDKYMIDPSTPLFQELKEVAAQKAAEANNEPSPEQQLAQSQVEAANIQAQAKLIEAQAKAELDREKFLFEKQLQAAEKDREYNFKVENMRREFALKEAELKLKYAEFGKTLVDVKDTDADFSNQDVQKEG